MPSASLDLLQGIPEQLVTDFKKLRLQKKAPLTQTAIEGIKREAAKAGMTLEAALTMCCERGWTGFNAEWTTTNNRRNIAPPSDMAAARKAANDEAKRRLFSTRCSSNEGVIDV
jgi:hypothetical protein